MKLPSVVWDSPSRDSSGSMPIGNGDIAANIWIEAVTGDLLLLLAKSDAWDECGRLLKLGRVRIHCEPSSPFAEGSFITQTLHLEEGYIRVQGCGPENHPATLTVFADANAPVIRVELQAPSGYSLSASFETWRTVARPLSDDEMSIGSSAHRPESQQPIELPDTLVPDFAQGFGWYHRNIRSAYAASLELQGLAHLKDHPDFPDPLRHRTFGGCIHRPNPGCVDIHIRCEIAESESKFLEGLESQVVAHTVGPQHFLAHVEWWRAFWERSHIVATAAPQAEIISRGYALQRYITACAGRGVYPIKFNGSLFTVEPADGKFTPDYRRWGGGYWIQNTRLAYWPMLAAGDFEMLTPCFRMYLHQMAIARERHRVFFNRPDAGCLSETAASYGLPFNSNYGGFDWARPGTTAFLSNPYINRHWNGMLELSVMMLDYVAYTGDTGFLADQVIPFVDAALRFFDQQNFTRSVHDGRMTITASTALETWWLCLDPMPDVAGLRAVTNRLLQLDASFGTPEQRQFWRELSAMIPDAPLRTDTPPDAPTLAPAATFTWKQNCETPELYGVFPFRLHGICREHLEPARRAFARRLDPMTCGWAQDEIFAAYLGLAEVAAAGLAKRFSTHDASQRFEAFWGPNFDWTPDQDHGCSGQIAFQSMLLQPLDDGRLLLFPAWPATWDVAFKLHAPQGTVIEATLVAGQITSLSVTPESRRKDIVLCLGLTHQ